MTRAILLSVSLVVLACGDDDSRLDAGLDAGRDAGFDASLADGGEDTSPDATEPLSEELEPGSHVQVGAGRVSVAIDTFGAVTARFGPSTRIPGTRDYAWVFGDTRLVVRFVDSNLDVDEAPEDVDDEDVVLSVSVQGAFEGATREGIGIGSARADVESAYGVGHEVAGATGSSLQFHTTGLVVELDAEGRVHEISVHRAYGTAPDGILDPRRGRVRFVTGDVRGQVGLARGVTRAETSSVLGEPDAVGVERASGQDLDVWRYELLGIEVLFRADAGTVLFLRVGAPFYGRTNGGVGIGDERSAMENFLSAAGYDAGTDASEPGFVCYSGDADVGVEYSEDRVTRIVTPLLICP